jgi:large subunit ribosomal protein L21
MYAIVSIGGQQVKVEKNEKVFVNRINEKEGKVIEIDEVLLIDNDKDIKIGEPLIKGASVSALIVDHVRGEKLKIFKKKRRKGYQLLKGHRQDYTQLLIENIAESGAKKAAEAKKKETPEKASAATQKTDDKPKAEVKKEPVKAPATKQAGTSKTAEKASGEKQTAKPASKAATTKTATKKATPEKGKAETKKTAAKPKATTAAKKETAKTTQKKTTTAKAAAAKKTTTKKQSTDKTDKKE